MIFYYKVTPIITKRTKQKHQDLVGNRLRALVACFDGFDQVVRKCISEIGDESCVRLPKALLEIATTRDLIRVGRSPESAISRKKIQTDHLLLKVPLDCHLQENEKKKIHDIYHMFIHTQKKSRFIDIHKSDNERSTILLTESFFSPSAATLSRSRIIR